MPAEGPGQVSSSPSGESEIELFRRLMPDEDSVLTGEGLRLSDQEIIDFISVLPGGGIAQLFGGSQSALRREIKNNLYRVADLVVQGECRRKGRVVIPEGVNEPERLG